MRTRGSTTGDILFGQTRSRVLALLFGAPEQTFFVRQIARSIETSVGSVQRELETLAAVGLVHRTTIGRQVFYRANRKHPAFAELRSLLAKTAGIFEVLRSALTPLEERISSAIVYGSVARAEDTAESDIDLMVIGDVTLDDLLTQLEGAERILGRPINPTVYSAKEFRTKLQRGNHFLKSVVRGKNVFLIGDEDELAKVA